MKDDEFGMRVVFEYEVGNVYAVVREPRVLDSSRHVREQQIMSIGRRDPTVEAGSDDVAELTRVLRAFLLDGDVGEDVPREAS